MLQAQSKYDAKLFANENLTALKKRVKTKKINKMDSPLLRDVALQMENNSYPLQERFRSYENYLSPFVLSKELKTSPYSQFENPTGIYFEEGDEAIVWVGETLGADIELVVADWANERQHIKKYPLNQGYNEVTMRVRVTVTSATLAKIRLLITKSISILSVVRLMVCLI